MLSPADAAPILVSVVVPVRARQTADVEGLGRCLAALARQRMAGMGYEVVVVDNGSTVDPTPAVRRWPRITLARISTAGSYAARNHGLRIARGRVLAFTDADCVPDADWLPRAVARLDSDPRLAAVAGVVDVPVTSQSGPVALYDALTAFPQRRFVERFGFGATANLVVHRGVLDTVGAFDPQLTSGGDAEWGARATAAGYRIGYAPDARVCHPPRTTVRAVVIKALRTTRGAEQLAALRGEAEPLHTAVLDRLGRPWRELPALLRDPRIP
ncbi:MAG TPA: glycosyltransferase, partial [Pseudonocardiaceae bacterium]|nr:glycosyltransferase [Pseudonocardiaceae bacterium]